MIVTQLAEAGYTGLLPVIPPGAELSPGSKIRPELLGKIPGRLGPRGWYGYDWRREEIEPERIDDWDANVGLRADHYPAVDIDIDQDNLAEAVVRYFRDQLGPAPTRSSRGARRLLVLSTEEPFPKMVLRVQGKGAVEVLGRGQQYLVAGTHPSGAEYGWQGDPLWEWDPVALSLVTQEQVRGALEKLAGRLRDSGFEVELTGAREQGPPPPQEELEAPSIGELRAAVRRLPNDLPTRDEWIAVGYAIRAASQEDPGAGLEIWREFSDRWTEGENDPELVEAEWESFTGPYRSGWPLLEELGFDAAEFFAEELGEELEEEVPGLPLVTSATLIAQPDPKYQWLVDGIIPLGGLMLMVAKPKVGKSTLLRSLAVAVATGRPWLGREVHRGRVILVSLEDTEDHVRRELRRIGGGSENLLVYTTRGSPKGILPALIESVRYWDPVLTVIDTYQRFLQVRDANDNAEVTAAMDPLLGMSHHHRVSVAGGHHARKDDGGDTADGTLGASAFFGSVDSGIFIRRTESGSRYLATRQRVHAPGEEDIPETLLKEDESGWPELLEVRLMAERREVEDRLLLALADDTLRSQEWQDRSGLGSTLFRRYRDRLVERGEVVVTGSGVGGSPYTYTRAALVVGVGEGEEREIPVDLLE